LPFAPIGSLNKSTPSRKNGRFSAKKISFADRLTCEGSASTCPKSGLIVADSVNAGPRAVAQIEAEVAAAADVLVERVAGVDRMHDDAAERVREQLEAARRREVIDAVDDTELADDLRRAARPRIPRALLRRAPDRAHDLEAPLLLLARGEPQLVERDPVLRGPAVARDRGFARPHRVPGVVLVLIVEQQHVALHAGGVELEHERRAAVVIGVEADRDHVGGDVGVAAREQRADLRRLRIARPHADVDRLVVVEHRELRVV
jgi:hypothetical protein